MLTLHSYAASSSRKRFQSRGVAGGSKQVRLILLFASIHFYYNFAIKMICVLRITFGIYRKATLTPNVIQWRRYVKYLIRARLQELQGLQHNTRITRYNSTRILSMPRSGIYIDWRRIYVKTDNLILDSVHLSCCTNRSLVEQFI